MRLLYPLFIYLFGAVLAQATSVEKKVISTSDAPQAIGPYSQALKVGNTLYLAGQIALDPETNRMVEGGIEAQTHRVLQNLGAVLNAAGFSFSDVVQAQVFLANLILSQHLIPIRASKVQDCGFGLDLDMMLPSQE